MGKYNVKIINRKEYINIIINELRNEYGEKRVGDTYMSEERLQKKYNEFINNEFEVAGVFDEKNQLMAFVSYKITPEGLFGDNILVFKNFRGKFVGTLLVRHIEAYARKNGCKKIYFGARRSANQFYFKLGFEGSCLIQSDKATKEDLEKLLSKYDIKDYSYNLYTGCNPPVNQVRVDAKYINNPNLLNEIDNSDLDIGCILTFSKTIQTSKSLKEKLEKENDETEKNQNEL